MRACVCPIFYHVLNDFQTRVGELCSSPTPSNSKATSDHCPREQCSHNMPWWSGERARRRGGGQARGCGGSCHHTGSVSTRLAPSGDRYSWSFSLTFSRIEPESSVLFTKKNQEVRREHVHQGFHSEDQTFSARRAELRGWSGSGRLSWSRTAELFVTGAVGEAMCGSVCRSPALAPLPCEAPSALMEDVLN